MNWKRVISGVLAAAMLSALPVQLLVFDGFSLLSPLSSLLLVLPGTLLLYLLTKAILSFTARTTRHLKRSPIRKRMSKPQTASWIIWETVRWRS